MGEFILKHYLFMALAICFVRVLETQLYLFRYSCFR